ncbi:MAG: hypothetical protein NVS3B3_18220 [Aquirhabdus sp.]
MSEAPRMATMHHCHVANAAGVPLFLFWGRLRKRKKSYAKPEPPKIPANQLAKTNQIGYSAFMEKPSPHCKLTVVKAFVEAGKVRATHSARLGATALGLGLSDMLDVVMALTPADFYKSMTTYADHTVWQDVYRPSTKAGDVYLKLTVIDNVLIVSFKEL